MENNEDIQKNNYINILDIILVLKRNILFIFIFTTIIAAIIVSINLLSIILPPDSPVNLLADLYKPEAKILVRLPGRNDAFAAALQNSEYGGIIGLLAGGSDVRAAGELTKIIIFLNEIEDKIINEFDFVTRYRINYHKRTKSREIYKNKIGIEMNESNSVLNLSFIDTDPEFATKVVNKIVAEITEKFKEILYILARQKTDFMESNLILAEKKYNELQNEIVAFQEENGVFDMTEQARETITNIAEMQIELAKMEMELESLLDYYDEKAAIVNRKQMEIARIKRLILDFRKGFDDLSGSFIPQDNIPKIRRKYMVLKLEYEIQSQIYTMLKQQYEVVKIAERDENPDFMILQYAEVPEEKYEPKRVLICMLVTIAGFFCAIIFVFIREYFKSFENDPESRKKLEELKLFKRKQKA
jgi:tyrosine-protein kinase Etk/Wzc